MDVEGSLDKKKGEGCLKEYSIGWMVCITSVVLNLFRTIPSYCFGVFIAEFKRIYDRPMMELNWIGVLLICLTDLFSPLPTVIIRRVGMKGYSLCAFSGTLILALGCALSSLVVDVRLLFFTHSLLNGLGTAMIMISSTLIVNEYFPSGHRFHVLATSLFQCSFPITILVFTPLYAWIIKESSWNVGFLIQAGKVIVGGSICSLVYLTLKKPIRQEEGEVDVRDACDPSLKDGKLLTVKKSDWMDVFKTPERMSWLIGITLNVACHLMPIMNLPHYMEGKGFQKVESSMAMVALGASEVTVYFSIVWLGDKFKGRLVYFNILSCFLMAVLMFLWSAIDPSYDVIIFLSFMLGLTATISFLFCYPASKETMNMEMDLAWTSTCVSMGFGCLINPIISGAIYDIRYSYDDVFYVVGGVSILNCLNFSMIPLVHRLRKKKCYDRLE